MNVNLAAAVAGLRESIEGFERSARQLTSTVQPDALASHIVETMAAQRGVQAQVAAVRTYDEVQGTLLDLLA
jgi:hypothetical protein